MSAYFRVSPNTGVSVPFWLLPLAAIVAVTVVFVAWLAMLLALGALLIVRGAINAYQRLRP